MAQYSLNAYDADIYIPEFKGLYQYGDHIQDDLRYSPEAYNCETIGGVLQPPAKIFPINIHYADDSSLDSKDNDSVLMCVRRQNVSNSTKTVNYEETTVPINPFMYYDTYYVTHDNKVYAMSVQGKLVETNLAYGYAYSYPTAPILTCPYDLITPIANNPIAKNRVSWCVYEVSLKRNEFNHATKENVLIVADGGSNLKFMADEWMFTLPTSPSGIVYVERFAERIWGVTAKNQIYYSHPYDATLWTANPTDPASGGGEIDIPTFDDDRVVAIKAFGSSLIVFSEKRAWKISGSDPTNFVVEEQYGNGTKYPDTIAVYDDYIIMLTESGLVYYDGLRVSPLKHTEGWDWFNLKSTESTMSYSPCAARFDDKYVLSMNHYFGRGTDTKEYAMFIYNRTDETLNVRRFPSITSFCGEYMLCAEHPEASQPQSYVPVRQYVAKFRYDSWREGRAMRSSDSVATSDGQVIWISPWITLGRTDIKKGGFELYFTPEVGPEQRVTEFNMSQLDDYGNFGSSFSVQKIYTNNVTLIVTIQTEKKKKSKSYTITQLTAAEIAAGKQYKTKRLHFGGSGRKFRLIIGCSSNEYGVPWRLVGGIHIVAETDKD